MSTALPSDEVAEDYKNSLEDLTMNSRYEISNLTVIAKENTEHGMAISRVLENHIRNTPPDRKLPALYVLDSIVKNVGTPYTLFLGRNLYQTFMNAYSLVNNQVRKKLDEMLKTWKEPVPGSLDTRPVFPVETTRPIENALIKARTIAVQQQQQQARSQQELMNRVRPTATPPAPWRSTPTPPQINGRYPSAPAQVYTPQNMPNGHVQVKTHSPYPAYQQYQHPQQAPPAFQPNYQQPTAYNPPPQPSNNLESLHRDISEIVANARNDFASNPWDQAIQGQLKALLELQSIVRNQQIPPDQIQQIRDQVSQMYAQRRAAAIAPTPAPAPAPPPAVAPPPVAQQQPVTQQQPDLRTLMSSDTLAQILASAAKSQQHPSTPPVLQVPLQPTQLTSSAPSMNPAPTPAENGSSLLASLRAAGILPPTTTTPLNGVSRPPPFTYPPSSTLARTPPPLSVNLPRHETRNDVPLISASLKIPRPHLLSTLYEGRPNQCSTCGRRFLLTPEGREKKARHLDWHFRTNQRLADSTRRGQSRSWYVDELEWIKFRDINEEGIEGSASGIEAAKALAAATAAKNDPKNKYIPVPDDSALANAPCPICQEKFETSWNEDAQDFVWMDATKIGVRVYHASCHAEVKKAGGNTPLRTATPESVLGKRKAAMNDINVLRSKMPKEIKA